VSTTTLGRVGTGFPACRAWRGNRGYKLPPQGGLFDATCRRKVDPPEIRGRSSISIFALSCVRYSPLSSSTH